MSMREWGLAYEEYLGGDALFTREEYEPRGPVKVSVCYPAESLHDHIHPLGK